VCSDFRHASHQFDAHSQQHQQCARLLAQRGGERAGVRLDERKEPRGTRNVDRFQHVLNQQHHCFARHHQARLGAPHRDAQNGANSGVVGVVVAVRHDCS
jgi:hypothetical protein